MVADYVIVGAGSAGCVLAGRLSEDPDVNVLLVEAGGPDSIPELHIPAAFPAVFKSSLDWDLLGEPEPGLGGRRLYLPRGRVIGGSGSVNAMIYLRGHRADFDEWAAAGCDGWSYDDVLPYFKRAEDNERGADAFHGVGGPLSVSDSRSMHPLIEAMLEAAVQAGYERIPDLNVDRPEGVEPLPAHPTRRLPLQHGRRVPAIRRSSATTSRSCRARSCSASPSKGIARSASSSSATESWRRCAPSAR